MMNIFNSLGSNYNLKFVWKSLTTRNNPLYHKQLIQFLDEKYQGKTILTYKGRESIHLGLKSLNLDKGTGVAITGFTCYAVYQAIIEAGLNPVYLDIDPEQLNFTADTLAQAIKTHPQIKVVIVQNTLGFPCDILEIKKICDLHHLILIEDLAHSAGTKYENNQEAGTVGDLIALSFSQDKIIDAISGGALITRSSKSQHVNMLTCYKISDRLYPLFSSIIRQTYPLFLGKIIHLLLKKINLLSLPINNIWQTPKQLSSWQAKLTLSAFENIVQDLEHRKKIASIYGNNLSKSILSNHLVKQIPISSNLRFPIFVPDRQGLLSHLRDNGIHLSDTWYDAPIAPQKYMCLTNYNGECPQSEKVSTKIINLPTHKNVTEKDAKQISQLINYFFQK